MRILYAGSPDISAQVLKDLYSLIEQNDFLVSNSNNNAYSGIKGETDNSDIISADINLTSTSNKNGCIVADSSNKEPQHSEIKIVGVLTNPPSMKGRHKELIPTPVETVARELNLPVFTPDHLREEARNEIISCKPDTLVVFAYGKIFGPKFLALFPNGGINLHPSLLPLHRGCAPANAAILCGDTKTGITVQKVGLGMDEGDILIQKEIPLTGTETADTILQISATTGGKLFYDTLMGLENGTIIPTPQDNTKATYCTMLKKEDGLIDWNKSVEEIDSQIRGFYPWPGAYTETNGTQLRIHTSAVYKDEWKGEKKKPGSVLGADQKQGILIQTGCGILCVKNLQWQAKKAMNYKDFINGNRNFSELYFGK